MLNVFLTSIFLASVSAAKPTETITIAAGEWPPFISEQLKENGIAGHIVKEALSRSNVRVQFVFLPWVRSFEATKRGKYVASISWAPTVARKKDFVFSDPISYHSKVFFHLKELDFNWDKVSDLKPYRIASTDGYTYGEEFDQLIGNTDYKIEVVPGDVQRIKMLFGQRIDLAPIDYDVGLFLVRKLFGQKGIDQVSYSKKPIMKTPMSVMFSKTYDQKEVSRLIGLLNKGLESMRAKGRIDQMFWNLRKGWYSEVDAQKGAH